VISGQFGYVTLMNYRPKQSERFVGRHKLRACVVALVGFTATVSANPQGNAAAKERRTFSRLCGRLEYVWAVPQDRHPKYSIEHRKPLSRTLLELFQWREGASCCSDLTLVESVATRRDGSFDFTNSSPGKYFVVAHWKGTHSLEIEITPSNGQEDDCTAQGLDIDENGKLDQFLTITF
jgi:hypothetical protein